jgi:pilus assembly protein CpaC
MQQPYGVTLNFTPVVLAEGRILLRVATEVSEIDPTNTVSFQTLSVSGFRTRKNETTVELPSGASIASAGLIQTISRQTINGLPGLMNLPILGTLFRSRDYQRLETELLIVVTPYIAKPVKPSELSRPTDNLADATDAQAVLLGRVNKIYSTANNPELIQNFKGKFGFIAD